MSSGEDFNDPEFLELLKTTLDDFDGLPAQTPASSQNDAANSVESSPTKSIASPSRQSCEDSKSHPHPTHTSSSSAPSAAGQHEDTLLQDLFQQLQMNGANIGENEEENLSQLLHMMESSMRDLMKEVEGESIPEASSSTPRTTSKSTSRGTKRKQTPSESGATTTVHTEDAQEAVVLEQLKRLTEELPTLEETVAAAGMRDRSGSPLSGSESASGLGVEEGDAGANIFGGFLNNMLRQLLDKDLIYPSLKPICDRYPLWLEENRASLSEQEHSQRQKQAAELQRVCDLYEANAEAWTQRNVNEAHLFQIMEHIEAAMRDGPPPESLLQSGEENGSEDVETTEQLQRLFQHAAQSGASSGTGGEQCSLM